eukprot:CAMPEP_0204906286 /NCGR_PEP_ID=MMETSP1397-20131031/5896_1 /ASSEMBLY_ACC=CAM_ASM_000891 /TAXON_ID=49980 /ORGANISM="Climacostomum Climacostomum virens, Strain Stock W-24" /LENGTH=256 /DNA_ID=CAMNT_0052075273 /DNA_START=527 /DNA_END=1294 /DNA_ORIENTATION=+
MAYAKFQGVDAQDFFITKLPFEAGAGVVPGKCSKIKPHHLTVFTKGSEFYIQAHAPLYLSTAGLIAAEDPPEPLIDLSSIHFPCKRHHSHIFYFVLPSGSGSPALVPIPENEETCPIEFSLSDGKRRRQAEDLTFDEKGIMRANPLKKLKPSKVVVTRDVEGNINFPILINNSLTILDLGYIEAERPAYFTDRNIFPVGFKSIREHSSMFVAGERMQYLCEILDGGQKPLFRVTPMKDGEPLWEHSIEKESCTGSW